MEISNFFTWFSNLKYYIFALYNIAAYGGDIFNNVVCMSKAQTKPEQNENIKALNLLACSKCQGRGLVKNKICRNCSGLGVVGEWGGVRVVWGRGFNPRSILQWEMGRAWFWFINIILFLVVVWGLLRLVINLQEFGFIQVFDIEFWLSSEMRPWWIAVLADSFLYYRFIKDQKGRVTLFDIKSSKKRSEVIAIAPLVSKDSWEVFKVLWKEAFKEKSSIVKPLHLFRALLEDKTILAIMVRLGVSPGLLKEIVDRQLSRQSIKLQPGSEPVLSMEFKQIIFMAFVSAWQNNLDRVEPQSFLRSLVQQSQEVDEILNELNKSKDLINDVIQWFDIDKQIIERYKRFHRFSLLRPKSTMNRAMTAIATPVLDQFSQDLTKLATLGYLDFCLKRNREIDQLFRLIEGGAKAVVLVGPNGVGKSTIIGAVAERMITEEVPDLLKDKRLVSLSLPKLLAGATAPGIVEERILAMRDEIVRSGNIVLFIDNIHDLVGASGQGDAGLDVSELIARIIERGEFPILATSTKVDYRRFIEGKALGSVLQKVDVEEADRETALAAMQSKVAFFEHKYNIFYSLDALNKIIELSDRYIHDQMLPEKAIRLMEEVAVYVKKIKGEKQMILAEDIAKLMSEKTDIPLAQITEVESEQLLNLEEIIHQRLVDQEEAVNAVASALRRARTQLRDEKRPIVNLLFLGPTGVGKTELAKTVAATYFGSEQEIVRLDMSEYQNKSSISRLIGSESDPSGGYLTESIKHKPYTVLLLDELEKAHPDILNVFLQVMDDGRLTDWGGQTVDFTNTIIIATSNAGTRFIQEEINRGVSLAAIREQLVRDKLKEYFRPEFLNRFDNIVVFQPLTPEHIKQIAQLLLKKNSRRLEEKGIKLEVTEAALEELAQAGFDPLFGARPMRRVIQDRVDDALAKYLLTGQVGRRDTVILDKGGKIKIKKAKRL